MQPHVRLDSQELYSLCIQRDCKRHGVVFFFGIVMGPAGEYQSFVGALGSADMHLSPPYDYTILLPVDHTDVEVLVLNLFGSAEAAVSLHVGYCPSDPYVILLQVFPVSLDARYV